MTTSERLKHYSRLMKAFKDNRDIRTNNFVGDMGETMAINHYNNSPLLPNLHAVEIGAKNIDAVSDTNERYSIKSTRTNMTGVFHGLNDPDSDIPQEQLFEYVIVMALNGDVTPKAIYELNWEAFLSLKKWNSSKRTWYLTISNELKRKSKIIYEQHT
ncbi:DUF6998 domain-containing protein [Bacillus thuringiensis]|uniref:DUF6998 domain-containing protein n=1 Tax=Bacillus thuringiensis TaxID=1428 RepID=UPI0028BF00E7|nr:hypothetical protein [Bacillus thuringiensis]